MGNQLLRGSSSTPSQAVDRLIRYRSFRNTDPPALAEIWRSQPRFHRLAQPMSAGQLEQHVFSKTYFDPAGLIVAVDGARPVGFVHAGFGPNALGSEIDPARGAICQLFVIPHTDRGVILVELLEAAEDYLRRQGAKQVFIGNVDGYGPFYLGFYGSASLLGTICSDTAQLAFFQEMQYEAQREQLVLQRSLMGFRPPVDRDQMRHRRTLESVARYDPPSRSWWEASTTSCLERVTFELLPKCGGPALASSLVWHMQPLCGAWGVRAAGLEQLWATECSWGDGTALMLMADTLKGLQSDGVTLVEAVVDNLESPTSRLLLSLGFASVDRGVTLRKTFSPQ